MTKRSVTVTQRRPGAESRAAAPRGAKTGCGPYYVVQESYSDGKFDRVTVFSDQKSAIKRYEDKVREHSALGLKMTGDGDGDSIPDGTLFRRTCFEASDGTDIMFRVMEAKDGEML